MYCSSKLFSNICLTVWSIQIISSLNLTSVDMSVSIRFLNYDFQTITHHSKNVCISSMQRIACKSGSGLEGEQCEHWYH